VWVHWGEIQRVRGTYGWWNEVDYSLIDGLIAAGAKQLPIAVDPAEEIRMPDGRPAIQMLELPPAVGQGRS
jgi:hypothetical protein